MEQIEQYHYIERASFGPRFAAYVLDLLFVGIAAMACAKLASLSGDNTIAVFFRGTTTHIGNSTNTDLNGSGSLLMLLYGLLELLTGASLGKRILGIQIKNLDASDATNSQYILRWLGKNLNWIFLLLSILTGIALFDALSKIAVIVLVVGAVYTLADEKRSFHDMLSKTAVYKTKNLILYDTKPLE